MLSRRAKTHTPPTSSILTRRAPQMPSLRANKQEILHSPPLGLARTTLRFNKPSSIIFSKHKRATRRTRRNTQHGGTTPINFELEQIVSAILKPQEGNKDYPTNVLYVSDGNKLKLSYNSDNYEVQLNDPILTKLGIVPYEQFEYYVKQAICDQTITSSPTFATMLLLADFDNTNDINGLIHVFVQERMFPIIDLVTIHLINEPNEFIAFNASICSKVKVA